MYKENLIVQNSLQKIELFDYWETKEPLLIIDNHNKLTKILMTTFNNQDILIRIIIGQS